MQSRIRYKTSTYFVVQLQSSISFPDSYRSAFRPRRIRPLNRMPAFKGSMSHDSPVASGKSSTRQLRYRLHTCTMLGHCHVISDPIAYKRMIPGQSRTRPRVISAQDYTEDFLSRVNRQNSGVALSICQYSCCTKL